MNHGTVFIYTFISLFIHFIIYLLNLLFADFIIIMLYLLIYLFTYLLIYLFKYWLTHSCICLFNNKCIPYRPANRIKLKSYKSVFEPNDKGVFTVVVSVRREFLIFCRQNFERRFFKLSRNAIEFCQRKGLLHVVFKFFDFLFVEFLFWGLGLLSVFKGPVNGKLGVQIVKRKYLLATLELWYSY